MAVAFTLLLGPFFRDDVHAWQTRTSGTNYAVPSCSLVHLVGNAVHSCIIEINPVRFHSLGEKSSGPQVSMFFFSQQDPPRGFSPTRYTNIEIYKIVLISKDIK